MDKTYKHIVAELVNKCKPWPITTIVLENSRKIILHDSIYIRVKFNSLWLVIDNVKYKFYINHYDQVSADICVRAAFNSLQFKKVYHLYVKNHYIKLMDKFTL